MRGSIQKRGDRTWRISVELERDPVTGRRRRLWQTVHGTKREAEARLAELIREAETGTVVDPSRVTVAEWLRRWLEQRRPYLRPSTWERYRQVVELRLIPTLGAHKLQRLRPVHVQQACGLWLEQGLAPRTVQKHVQVLHRALADAVRLQLVARNVAEHAEVPSPGRPNVGPLPRESIAPLLHALGSEPPMCRAAGFLLLYTGMRRGELLGLTWEDVDLDAGVLSIRQSRVRAGSRAVVGAPKTAAGVRTVPIAPPLAAALRDWRRTQLEQRLAAGPEWRGEDYVLATRRGPLSVSSLTHWWASFCRRCGIRVRMHDLRHTAATLMAAVGVPPRVIAEVLGHARPSFTLDVYAGSSGTDELRRAIDSLARALGALGSVSE